MQACIWVALEEQFETDNPVEVEGGWYGGFLVIEDLETLYDLVANRNYVSDEAGEIREVELIGVFAGLGLDGGETSIPVVEELDALDLVDGGGASV